MSAGFRNNLAKWSLFIFALLPLVLWAVLGQYSRMIPGDDYIFLSSARDTALVDYFSQWWEVWTGAYSFLALHRLVVRFDYHLVRAMPVIILLIWTLGMYLLLERILRAMGVGRNRRVLALGLAAVVVAATIQGLHIQESFFWYAASIRYPLALALFVAYVGAVLRLVERAYGGRLGAAMCGWSAMASFAIAGLSEPHALFQAAALGAILMAIWAFGAGIARRGRLLAVFGAGLIGSFACLVVLAIAPGTSARADYYVHDIDWVQPVRNLVVLATESTLDVVQYISHVGAVAGFVLVFALCTCLILQAERIPYPAAFSRRVELGRWQRLPFLLSLLGLCAMLPLLIDHSSDSPSVFNRWSWLYFAAIVANVGGILCIGLLLWRFERFWAICRGNRSVRAALIAGLLMGALLCTLLVELRPMYYKVNILLYIAIVSALGIACWLGCLSDDGLGSHLLLIALAWTVASLVIAAAIVAIPLYVSGFFNLRYVVPIGYMVVCSGAVWALAIATVIKRRYAHRHRLLMAVKLVSALVFLAGNLSMLGGQFAALPDYQTFASEWHARDALLRDAAERGQVQVELPPLAFNLWVFLRTGERVPETELGPRHESSLGMWYRLESITLRAADEPSPSAPSRHVP